MPTPTITPRPQPVLSVRRLKVHFPQPGRMPWSRSGLVRAVDDLHFNLYPGETLGIVGESGCGKSTLARAIIGLQPITAGQVQIDGQDISKLDEAGWHALRRTVQMVFQDPLASLDPRMTVGEIVAEPLAALFPEVRQSERRRRVAETLEHVGLSRRLINRYPHEFSGGQCQRVGIARALIVDPRILICDEPVSALDVSVRAQIVNLLAELQRDLGLAMIFIAHDLAVVRHISHRVLVMYLGKVMEQAERDALFTSPSHPYTRALLSAVPLPDPVAPRGDRVRLQGDLPSQADPPSGCVFRTRCPMVDSVCAREVPVMRKLPTGNYSACHFAGTEESPMIPRTA